MAKSKDQKTEMRAVVFYRGKDVRVRIIDVVTKANGKHVNVEALEGRRPFHQWYVHLGAVVGSGAAGWEPSSTALIHVASIRRCWEVDAASGRMLVFRGRPPIVKGLPLMEAR